MVRSIVLAALVVVALAVPAQAGCGYAQPIVGTNYSVQAVQAYQPIILAQVNPYVPTASVVVDQYVQPVQKVVVQRQVQQVVVQKQVVQKVIQPVRVEKVVVQKQKVVQKQTKPLFRK
jgi:Ni,Fe-hydrogenase I cytochrome b subunit